MARYWFHKKHPFRDYTTRGKGTGIYPIGDRAKISIAGDWGTGTDEARIVATGMQRGDPDYTIHLGDVYYVGNTTEVRENFLGEKTSPYAPVKWPMGSKGGFALNGNHEMYADGNGYWRTILAEDGPDTTRRRTGARDNGRASSVSRTTTGASLDSTPATTRRVSTARSSRWSSGASGFAGRRRSSRGARSLIPCSPG